MHVAKALEEALLRGEGALQGLDDDAGELVVVALDDGGGGLDVVEGRDEHVARGGRGDAEAVGRGRREVSQVGGRRGHAHHGVVVGAVEGALELQDLVAAAVGAGDAHGVEGGLGAAAGEAHLLGAGDGADDLLGQQQGVLVEAEVRGTPGELLLDGGDDLGVRVADEHGAGAEDVVDVLVAADVPDAGAAAPGDDGVHRDDVAGAASRQDSRREVQKLPLALAYVVTRHECLH